jgi:hypothetical protein
MGGDRVIAKTGDVVVVPSGARHVETIVLGERAQRQQRGASSASSSASARSTRPSAMSASSASGEKEGGDRLVDAVALERLGRRPAGVPGGVGVAERELEHAERGSDPQTGAGVGQTRRESS